MYCANCGVKLADDQKKCPICGTRAYHPDITRTDGESQYPKDISPREGNGFKIIQMLVTALVALAAVVVFLCDMQFGGGVSWSGYVIGALGVVYVAFVLPSWFKRPNPVIFVPSALSAALVYVLYINIVTDGNWFLTFAFPVGGAVILIISAVVTLMKYVRRGALYIFGGALISVGGLALLVEFLLELTFSIACIGWSLYPLVTLALLGGFLIFLAICRPAREAMERKFFI